MMGKKVTFIRKKAEIFAQYKVHYSERETAMNVHVSKTSAYHAVRNVHAPDRGAIGQNKKHYDHFDYVILRWIMVQ